MHDACGAPRLPPVFLGRDAVAAGLLTPAQLRGPSVRPVLRGVYAPAGRPMTHAVRCAAAGLVLHPTAQLTGTSMATVLGVRLARSQDDVTVVIPDRSQQERFRGIAFRRVSAELDPGVAWETTRLASRCRMGFDLAARAPLAEAVSRLDAVTRAGLLDVEALRRWLDGRRDNDLVRVRRAVELVDPRAESLPESVLRVHLVRAGFDVTPQHEVQVDGRRLRLDLALVRDRVAVEYDGAWHSLREQLEVDRRRMGLLREAGWIVVHVTASMLARPDEVVAAVRRAVAAVGA